MMSILRPSRLLVAVALACAAAPSAAAQQPGESRPEVGVMPYFGSAFILAMQGGLQIQVRPSANSDWTFFADYNRWVWGLVCVGVLAEEGGVEYYDDRCGEEGNAIHVGAMRTFNRAGKWQPYVSAGAGLSEVVTRDKDDRPSFLLESGVDIGGRKMLNGRLGLRYQTRPGAGGGGLPADFVGPVMALRLTF
jgi:hypothetical protein